MNRSDLTRKEREMWNISVQGAIHLGAVITVDVLFHFMYIVTIPNDMKLLKHMSDWALGPCHLPGCFINFYSQIEATFFIVVSSGAGLL